MQLDSLVSNLNVLVANNLPLALPERTAFIVGVMPSQGARSPRLWNAAFQAEGWGGEMLPLDVAQDQVVSVLKYLEADPRVIGVAIAAPYKSLAAELYREDLTRAAAQCESINLLFRSQDNRFVGSNTDGLAAFESLREVEPEVGRKHILLMGCGATGRAVAAVLGEQLGSERLVIAHRNPAHAEWISRLGATPWEFSKLSERLASVDVLINCTTIGWGDNSDQAPLSEAEIGLLQVGSLVFDVIYQPDPTRLLRLAKGRGLRAMSGMRMNLLQASMAFCASNPKANHMTVQAAMRSVIGTP
jgi:shikimate dehydrogenase